MSLGDPGLTIDVRQAHLPLLVQLPVEADRVLQVVLVRRVIEEPFEHILQSELENLEDKGVRHSLCVLPKHILTPRQLEGHLDER